MSLAAWIEANAGTGKTSRLTDEIVSRFRNGMAFDRVCAVTFTEKAANEMVERLRAKVVEMVQQRHAPPSALDRLNDSFVGTIHAFCSRLLRRYGNKLGLPPLFTVDADGSAFQSLLDARWDRFVGRHLKMRGEHENYIRTFGLDALRQMVEKLAQRRFDFRPMEPDNPEWLIRDLQNTEKWEIPERGWVLLLLQALTDFSRQRDLMEIVLDAIMIQEHTAWKNAVLDLLRCKHAAFHSCLSWLKHHFVKDLLAEYRALGYLRFDDMILDTREILKNDRDVRREMKSRFDLVLVDEMQDTDPVQYEIFLYLCEKQGRETDFTLREIIHGSRKLELEPNKFFGVGDPKQSIYGFRSADIGAYDTVKGWLVREGVKVEPLTTNFRSCANIVSFTNRLARHLFAAGAPEDSLPARDFCAGKSRQDCIHLVEVHSENAAEQHLRVLTEANWLATRVHALIGGAKRKPQHIGILLRKLTSAHLYVDALSSKNIRVVIEGEKFFYQSQEVIDFLNLLKCVVDDMDDLALAGTLRSPLFGLSDPELAAYFRGPRELEDPTHRQFLGMIGDLRSRLRALTPGSLVSEILNRLPVMTVAALAYGVPRRELAPLNLLKIHKLALEADGDPEMSAVRFVRELESFAREAKQAGQEPMADEALPAVRIMSIHQSKGLDFPVLFVPLSDYGTGAFEDAAIVLYDWKTDMAGLKIRRFTEANYLRLKYGRDEESTADLQVDSPLALIDDEERRVLYVAATRAKEEIYFSYVPPVGKKSDSSAGRPVLDLLAQVLGDQIQHETAEPWLDEPDAPAEAPRAQLASLMEGWEPLQRAAERSSRPRFVSVTEEASREEEGLRNIPPAAALRARLIGLLCHGVLERVNLSEPEGLERLVEKQKALLSGTFRESDVEEAASESQEILESFFQSEAARWLASVEVTGREVPLILFDPDGGRIVSGKVDLVVRENGTLYLIDYKTNVVLDDASRESYARQMEWYGRALKSAAGDSPIRKRLCLLRSAAFVDL